MTRGVAGFVSVEVSAVEVPGISIKVLKFNFFFHEGPEVSHRRGTRPATRYHEITYS